MFASDARRIFDSQLQLRGGFEEPVALAGTVQLGLASAAFQLLDPDGVDREVRMPDESLPPDIDGTVLRIVHGGGANLLLLRDSAGAPIAGVTTQLAAGQAAWVAFNGTSWRHYGIETIVL